VGDQTQNPAWPPQIFKNKILKTVPGVPRQHSSFHKGVLAFKIPERLPRQRSGLQNNIPESKTTFRTSEHRYGLQNAVIIFRMPFRELSERLTAVKTGRILEGQRGVERKDPGYTLNYSNTRLCAVGKPIGKLSASNRRQFREEI